MVTMIEFDKAIRELTGEHIEARPFLCEGSPFGCEIFLVGINPGTPTPFWPRWRLPYGCYKQEWLSDYLRRPGQKPTRKNIERIISAAAPVRCLDTNVFCRFSPDEASLPPADRDTRVFDYLLQVLTPKVLFVHGESGIKHIEWLAGNRSLPAGEFTRVSLLGIPVDVITGQHLSYPRARWSSCAERLGRALRERCRNTEYQLPNNGVNTDDGDLASLHPSQRPVPIALARGDTMDFEVAWAYLRQHQPIPLVTSGGTPFTVEVSDTTIAYQSEVDQTRTQSKDNFEKYFRERRKDSNCYRNFAKEGSRSARGRYFREVFRYLDTNLGSGPGI